jgi:hypothetical protein
MNRFERNAAQASEAKLRYMDGEFQVLSPGNYVRCAVTGDPVAIADLRYWSVALQEPYLNAEVSMRRYLEVHGRPKGR